MAELMIGLVDSRGISGLDQLSFAGPREQCRQKIEDDHEEQQITEAEQHRARLSALLFH